VSLVDIDGLFVGDLKAA